MKKSYMFMLMTLFAAGITLSCGGPKKAAAENKVASASVEKAENENRINAYVSLSDLPAGFPEGLMYPKASKPTVTMKATAQGEGFRVIMNVNPDPSPVETFYKKLGEKGWTVSQVSRSDNGIMLKLVKGEINALITISLKNGKTHDLVVLYGVKKS